MDKAPWVQSVPLSALPWQAVHKDPWSVAVPRCGSSLVVWGAGEAPEPSAQQLSLAGTIPQSFSERVNI